MIRRYLNAIFLRRRNRLWPLVIAAVIFSGWLLLIKQSEVREERILNAKHPHENIGAFDGEPHKPLDSAKRHGLPVSSETDAKSKNAPLSSDDDICAQRYQTEAKTDYQTCDMWKNLSLRGGFPGDYYSTLNPKNLPQDDKYKVFIMPMTHVDPGWLETFDEYSKDTNNILTYMLRFLKAHKDMRFTWCELVFFERWWRTVTDEDKKAVKGMVESGQLELTSGSWVMTDEANPYFPITVDNIVEGHQFLKKELDVTPKVMWSNDPFGYGPSVPYLFRKAGVKNAVINRIHRGMKMELQKVRAVPFKWRQLWDALGENDVYTHVLPFGHYDVLSSCGPNPGVCCQFDFKRITHFSCPGPKPVPITDANVAQKADMLFDQFKRLSTMYESPIILMVLGDDFRFNSESEWSQHYDNFVPLFKYMNEKYKDLEIGFGTYSDFFREQNKWNAAKGVEPKSVSGDFFPYNDWGGDYWTGYFTTRPFFKRRGRKLHAHIRAADLMSASAFKNSAVSKQQKNEMIEKLTMARRNLSLFQHHDAITGTSRVNVMEDYGKLLWSALDLAREVIEQCASVLLGASTGGTEGITLNEYPPTHNVSEIKQPLKFHGSSPVSVGVYNQLPNERIEVVVLHVPSPKIKVTDGDVTVDAQIEPLFQPGEAAVHNNLYQLVFLAKIPALGFKVFKLSEESEQPDHTSIVDVLITAQGAKHASLFPKIFKIVSVDEDKLKIKTSRVETFHDPSSGYTKAVTIEGIGKKKFETSFYQYENTRSGAYIFAPHGEAILHPGNNPLHFVTRGPLQQTAHVRVDRLYQSLTVREVPGAEGEQLHFLNTIDLRALNNLEVVVRFATDVNLADRQFFADSIGLQMLRREAFDKQPIEANYYPMPTAAFVQDEKNRVTVLGDVSHGVTSPKPGQLEIMLDRILSQDDNKGLGYGPNSLPKDNVPVTVGFTVVFETVADDRLPAHFAHHSSTAHQALQTLMYPPMVLTSSASLSKPTAEAIASFPCDVQLLTNRPLPTGVDERLIILSRPGVDCRVGTTPQLCSGKLDINEAMRTYLKSLSVTAVTETSLSGVEELKAEQKVDSVDFQITPMDLRAFKLRL